MHAYIHTYILIVSHRSHKISPSLKDVEELVREAQDGDVAKA
jgi:hypothetical protein